MKHTVGSIALSTSVVLLVTLLSPTTSVAAEEVTSDPTSVAPLVSAPLDSPESAYPIEHLERPAVGALSLGRLVGRPRPVDATAELGAGFDEAESDVKSFTEFSTTYANPDGTETLKVSEAPMNARNDAGEWVPVSTRVQRDDDGRWSTDAHPLDPSFAATADEGNAFKINRGSYDIGFTLRGVDDSAFSRLYLPRQQTAGDDIVYRDVFEDVDLTYSISKGAIKESLILHSVPAAGQSSWVWDIDSDGLDLVVDEHGSIRFVDVRGNVQVFVPAPVMWDSSGVEGESEPDEINVKTRVWRVGDGWAMSLTPDRQWLTDPDRVYPVTIDPTYQHNPGGGWFNAYKSDGAYRNDSILVGNARNNGNRYWRTVLHFPFSGMAGNQLLDANLYIRYNYDGTTNWAGGNVYGANCLGYHCLGPWYGGYSVSNGGMTIWDDNMAYGYAYRMAIGDWGHYVEVTGEEGGSYTYKNLAAQMLFTYKPYPAVTGYLSPSPAEGAKAPVRPTFNVSANDTGWPIYYRYVIGTTSNIDASKIHETPWGGAYQQLPDNLLAPGTTYYWRAEVHDGAHAHLNQSTVRASGVRSFVTNTPAPTPSQASASPTDGEVRPTLTPTLTTATVVDPDSSTPVQYQFTVATGSDGKSGALASSGWLSSPTWTVPEGVLQDGGRYSWAMWTNDGMDENRAPAWVNKFTVNLRLGTSGPSPFDSAGPVTVNLANGNASLSFSSPLVSTLGGPMGLSFAYNSQQSPTQLRGLTASYFDALNPGQTSTTTFDFNRTAKLVRTDTSISFDWLTGSPGPAVPSDYFLARWGGFVQVPANGTYTFGVVRDEGAKLTVNNQVQVDQWNSNGAAQAVWWGSAQTLTTTPVQVGLDYYDSTGAAKTQLWVRAPDGPDADTNPDEFPVPAQWLSTRVQTLPNGWASSTPIAGSGGFYVSARVSEASIILTDATGSVHTYAKAATGGYTAPLGEYGVMSLDGNGWPVLSEADGTVYAFGAQGQVLSVTSPADALKPATPIVTYRPTTGQADSVSDPLSVSTAPNYDRKIKFVYQGDSAASVGLGIGDSDMSGTACPIPSGFAATPPGMLCRIIYPGHVEGQPDTTRLLYNAAGQLVRIIDPGNEVTEFAYGTDGRLSAIRDSLAMDWLAYSSTTPSAAQTTEIVYDGQGKVTAVTLPAPDGITPSERPKKTFTYGSGTTFVDVAGLSVPSGHAKTVTYDSSWRQVSATSAMGLTATQEWNAKDMVLSSTDARGIKATTIYDKQDRPTDVYGPAPASCFDNTTRLPVSGCVVTPGHSSTAYDQGLLGLHIAYYTNPSLSGAPKTFSHGLGSNTGGAVNKDWTTLAPVADVTETDNWSMRATGLITYPSQGVYEFRAIVDDGAALWINDVIVFDDWAGSGAHTTYAGPGQPVAAGQKDRIRLQYREGTGSAKLELQWKVPGSTVWVTVPGTALGPDYGLANGTKTEDSAPTGSGLSNAQAPSIVTALEYTHPWLGAVTASIIDPGGLNLRTETSYENPGTLWLRRIEKRMPSTVAQPSAINASTTFDHWDPKEQLGFTACGLPASTPQSGFLRKSTGPTPAVGGAIVTEYVYDLFGRTVGTKRSGDATWTCSAFDLRGRTTSTVFSAFGTSPARTATYNYASGGNPLVSYVEDGAVTGSPNGSRITTVIDLLGRSTSYTDVWNTVTTPTYEPLTGRVTQVSTTPAGGVPSVQSFTYDLDGKVELVKLDGVTYADPVYASNQLLQSVSYLNGTSLSSIVRGATGSTDAITWSFPNVTVPSATVPHEATTAYTTGFETGADSWAGVGVSTQAHTGTSAATATQTSDAPAVATRTVTGLTVGRSYTLEAWVATTNTSTIADAVTVGVAGVGDTTPVTADPYTTAPAWVKLTYPFTATAASHDLQVQVASSGTTGAGSLLIDDVTLTQNAWTETIPASSAPQPSVTDSVIRSQSGRILKNTLTDGATVETSTYTYDAAGRLIQAVIPRHTLTYAFAQSDGCGANPAAGRNGNRTSSTDVKDGGTPTTTTYCYDNADRLTSTTVTNPPAGASPITGTGLTATTLQYEAHGNTIKLADQTLGYDVADRHMTTTLDDGTTIVYERDATGRIVARKFTPTEGDSSAVRFSYAGSSVVALLEESGNLLERIVQLPGAVRVSVRNQSDQTWTYTNLHADNVIAADFAGLREGSRLSYDPFGQPLDPGSGDIGTLDADDAPSVTSTQASSVAWLGAHEKLYELAGTVAAIEMGDRQYSPSLGRFLEVDPVEGGLENAYVYVSDPINQKDIEGRCPWCVAIVGAIGAALLVVARVVVQVVVKVVARYVQKIFPPRFNGPMAPAPAAQRIAQMTTQNLRASTEYALQPNQLAHVFKPKHGFDVLAPTASAQPGAMTRIIQSVGAVDDGLYNGLNPIIRTIDGVTVHIEGNMINGVFKIGTAWVVP